MKKLLAIAAIAVLAPSLAAAADLTGNWKLKTDAGGMELIINCKFVQAGAALSGTCGLDGAPDAPSPFTGGTVDGATAKWGYEVNFQDMKFNVAYTGTVKDTTMSGTMNVLDMPSPFTATKQ
jgi:opacity protein-like surface antigen